MLRWFANLKVAHKLALGFGLVLLLLIGTLVADVYVSAQQSTVADHIIHHLNPAVEAAHEQSIRPLGGGSLPADT